VPRKKYGEIRLARLVIGWGKRLAEGLIHITKRDQLAEKRRDTLLHGRKGGGGGKFYLSGEE